MRATPSALAADVVAMREKMHAAHPNAHARCSTSSTIRAAWSTSNSASSTWCWRMRTRTPRCAATRATSRSWRTASELGLVPDAIAQAAADAYREYRRLQHQIRLQGAREARIEPAAQAARRADVAALWQNVFGQPRTVERSQPIRPRPRGKSAKIAVLTMTRKRDVDGGPRWLHLVRRQARAVARRHDARAHAHAALRTRRLRRRARATKPNRGRPFSGCATTPSDCCARRRSSG